MQADIKWLGQSSFQIKSAQGKIIYFDPWKIKDGLEPADIILITHPHFDHFSPEDIAKIQKESTQILAPAECQQKIHGQVQSVAPSDQLTIQGIKIQVIPAYNTNKAFHPRANQWVGYVIEVDGQKIYHAGDTDLIPEMENIKADIALLPVSGTYVMTAEEAAHAANLIKPKLTIPMHYGDVVGSRKDAESLAAQVSGEVKILSKV